MTERADLIHLLECFACLEDTQESLAVGQGDLEDCVRYHRTRREALSEAVALLKALGDDPILLDDDGYPVILLSGWPARSQ